MPQNVSPSGHNNTKKPNNKQDVATPAVAEPPFNAPLISLHESERDSSNHQSHRPEGDDPKGDSGPKITDWVQAISAAVTFLATLGLLYVGRQQLETYRLQAKIMRDTREIAFAALGRPHIFVEMASHNLEKWREGHEVFSFKFRVVNYGNGPAVVTSTLAYAFLSRGLQHDI